MMMADNHLPLPILPEPEIKEMAAMFSKIWRSSHKPSDKIIVQPSREGSSWKPLWFASSKI